MNAQTTRERIPGNSTWRWATGIVALAAFSLLLGSSVLARAQERTAEETVSKTIEEALGVLRDPSWQGADKRGARVAKLRSLVDPVFDWAEMSKRSLGVHWRSIDEAQRKQFVDVFADLLAEHYMGDIDRFRGTETIEILGAEEMGPDRLVKTTLTTHSGERVPIHYVLHQEGGGWHVYDVNIEGVSLVNHYRTGFSRQLTNRAFGDLLGQLTRKRDNLRAQQ